MPKLKFKLIILAILIAPLLLSVQTVALAQQAQFTIFVSSNAPASLTINGLDVPKLTGVASGSTVCIPTRTHYSSTTERWLFQDWSHGPTSDCVTLTQAGVYIANYRHEVLLTTPSPIKEHRKTSWVEFGTVVTVQVPSNVDVSQRERYSFQEWSDGESPFQTENRIAALKPTSLEAKWNKEYFVRVEGPAGTTIAGSGWYLNGSEIVLQAPLELAGPNPSLRYKFSKWEAAGASPVAIADPLKSSIAVKVQAAHDFKAVYDSEFLIQITNPAGVLLKKWSLPNSDIDVETPPIIETIPGQTRLVFRRWDGLEGVLSPTIKGIVDGPLELKAVYEKQYMVAVKAPYGSSGEGWYKEGSTANVLVPGSSQKNIILSEKFSGFAESRTSNPSTQILVDRPLDMEALYSTTVNLAFVSLILFVVLAGIVTYFIYRIVVLKSSAKEGESETYVSKRR